MQVYDVNDSPIVYCTVFLDEATNTRSVKVENLAHISVEHPIKINLYFNNYDTSEITGSFQVS